VINVIADPERPQDGDTARWYNEAQFDAWDMIAGRKSPHLGGHEKYLDILGLNYYPHNQWIYSGEPFNPSIVIPPEHPSYRPFRHILADLHKRYERPMFIAETGADGERRPDWLRYVGREVRGAIRAGVPVGGLCIYPIVNYPTWEGGHNLNSGLWDYADERGERDMCVPLARELRRQIRLFSGIVEAEENTATSPDASQGTKRRAIA
jgi:hypothetical protein